MKRSIKRKSLLSVVVVILIAIVIGLSISFAFSNRFYMTVKQRSLKTIYREVNDVYNEANDFTGLDDDAVNSLYVLCEENNLTMIIVEPNNSIDFSFGDSDVLYERFMDSTFSRDEESNVRNLENSEKYTIRLHQKSQRSSGYLELVGVLDNGDYIVVSSSFAGISNSANTSVIFFCFVCLIIFIFITVMGFLIIRPYANSLNNLLAFAEKANKGDFEAEYESGKSHKDDEIGMLGTNISEMSHKLEKTIAELKTTNLKLEKELKGRIALDEARKKYMSDVSHELKTPIALIAGYAEGLKEGISDDPEDRDYYCDVIIDEAEKMNQMIKKLATLNQLENSTNEVILERFNVIDVINGYLNKMAMIIEEKGANIYFDSTKTVYVWSDEFLVEEVLMNFFNNAMNHVDERKIIKIDAYYLDDKTVRMTVFNAGSSIAEEEQDKIWGSFYKVDKARTRAYGGSGLGLSIVKAIANSLGKECGVRNVDDGVEFWINLEGVERPAEDEAPSEEENPKKEHKLLIEHLLKSSDGSTGKQEVPSAEQNPDGELPIWRRKDFVELNGAEDDDMDDMGIDNTVYEAEYKSVDENDRSSGE